MEFIPSAPTNVPVMAFFIGCMVAVFVGVPLLATASEHAKTTVKRRVSGILAFIVGVSGALGMAVVYFGGDPAVAARNKAVWESLDTYGLDLSKEERTALEYPRDRPESDFQVFGSFMREGPTDEGFSRQTVYLIWKDGLLHLAASPDGEQFTVLETR